MANRTHVMAKWVHGTNPQYLVEKIIRMRIYETQYWKEDCFGLSAETIVDRAVALDSIGGTFGGGRKPTNFLCLILKMLQIQPSKDIIIEFLKNEDYKYVRALGAFYLRLVGTAQDCYRYLEPFYNDFRKLREQQTDGSFQPLYMDNFIDQLLREERVCDVLLPRIVARHHLEDNGELEPRVSMLDDDEIDFDLMDDEADIRLEDKPVPAPRPRSRSRSRSRSPRRGRTRRSRSRSRSREYDRDRRRDDRGRERERDRHDDRDRRRDDRERGRERKRSRSPLFKNSKSSSRREHRGREREKETRHKHDRDRDEDKSGGGGSGGGKKDSLSIEETNRIREKAGLKPLK